MEGNRDTITVSSLEKCVSVLVGTGVYDPSEPEPETVDVDHGHRDLPFKAQLCKANIISDDVLTAMKTVFGKNRKKHFYRGRYATIRL